MVLSEIVLKKHYEEYANQSDDWVNNMEKTKASIVKYVIKHIKPTFNSDSLNVCVLGASDKRYIPIHKRIFETILKKKIQMTTLDLDISHLAGKKSEILMQHDVNKTFPKTFDIIFSHELMKFLTQDEQLKTIENSYSALNKNGFTMHIIHEPSIKGTKELRDWQFKVNPDLLIEELKAKSIIAEKLVFKSESIVSWLRDTTVIVTKK